MIQLSTEVLALSGEPVLLARGGKILFANEAACSLLGTELKGESVREVLGPEISGMQADSFVGESEVRGRRILLRVRTAEGLRVIFLSPCTPPRKLLGDAFFYAVRSELMRLGMSVSILRAKLRPEDGDSRAALRSLSQSLYIVNRTVQNLAVINGIEDACLPFQPQTLDLVALLRDLIDGVRLFLPEPEIGFSAPGRMEIRGDAALLETMALNLLSNCFLHAEGCTRIRVTLHSAGEQVILSVDDDGCGIPGDRLHSVLERYRFSSSMQDMQHGPGFGLTAAREIARLHGGTLLLESREGIGTAVRVSLSLAPRAAVPLQVPVPDYNKSCDTLLTGLSVCLPPEAFEAVDS